MRSYVLLLSLSCGLGLCGSLAADDPIADFAHVEARGKFGDRKFAFGAINRDRWDRWVVTVERKEGAQTLVLTIRDEAIQRTAKELIGQSVIAKGEINLQRQGDGKRNKP